jgi:hypothetical protein
MVKLVNEIYEFEPIEQLELRATTLYGLSPVEAKGKDVESLSSYITRLANAHNVTISDLINKVLSPYFSENGANYKTPHINGFGSMAISIVDVLGEFTNRTLLKELTLIKYKAVFSRTNLFKPNKAWCSYCLKEMQETSEGVYEKLIWLINGYDYCIKHSRKLNNFCSKCGSSQNVIPVNGVNGFCQNCNEWLGDMGNVIPNINEGDEIFQNSQQLEQMFDNFINTEEIEKEGMVNALTYLRNKVPIDVIMNELNYEITYTQFKSFCYQKVPQIQILLLICSKFNISIVDILRSENIDLLVERISSVKHVYDPRIDFERFRDHLETILMSSEYFPIYKIAEDLNSCKRTLRNNFPELTQAIKDKNKKLLKVTNRHNTYYNHERDYFKVEKYLEECLNSPDMVPMKEITRTINVTIVTLEKRFPYLIRKIKDKNIDIQNNQKNIIKEKKVIENHKSNNYDTKVRAKLTMIINSIDNEPMNFNYIEKELDVSKGTIKRKFKDLYELIVNKNKELREINKEKVHLQIKEQIINAINALCSDGIYPSFNKVDEKIDMNMNQPKYTNVWREHLAYLKIERKSFRNK